MVHFCFQYLVGEVDVVVGRGVVAAIMGGLTAAGGGCGGWTGSLTGADGRGRTGAGGGGNGGRTGIGGWTDGLAGAGTGGRGLTGAGGGGNGGRTGIRDGAVTIIGGLTGAGGGGRAGTKEGAGTG